MPATLSFAGDPNSGACGSCSAPAIISLFTFGHCGNIEVAAWSAPIVSSTGCAADENWMDDMVGFSCAGFCLAVQRAWAVLMSGSLMPVFAALYYFALFAVSDSAFLERLLGTSGFSLQMALQISSESLESPFSSSSVAQDPVRVNKII
jgi:hypothetical protein